MKNIFYIVCIVILTVFSSCSIIPDEEDDKEIFVPNNWGKQVYYIVNGQEIFEVKE